MLTIAFGRAVGLVLLYLSAGCCCLYIRNLENEPLRNGIRGSQRRIQICGSRLTSMIMSICDGYVNSPKEDYGGKLNRNRTKTINIDQAGVVEKCCRNQCEFEFLLQHCAEKPNLETLLQSNAEIAEIGDLANYLLGNETFLMDTDSPEPKTTTPDWAGKDKSDIQKDKKMDDVKHIKPQLLINSHRGKVLPRWKIANIIINNATDTGIKPNAEYRIYDFIIRLLLLINDQADFTVHVRKNVETFEIGTIKPEVLGGDPVVVRSPHIWRKGKANLLSSSKNLRKSIVAQY